VSEQADLSSKRQRLLELLRREREAQQAAQEEPLSARLDRSVPAPLSFGQQRLWFLQQLDPLSSTYNISAALDLRGDLDIFALEQALNGIVDRHEVLRSRIKLQGDQPVQIVCDAERIVLAIDNQSLLDEGASEADVQHLIGEEARRPFDLANDQLLRARLVRCAIDDHVLIIVIHHIACDGWSIDILVRELTALYRAYKSGRPSPLSPLKLQYADVAARQRRRLSGEYGTTLTTYWTTQLAELPLLSLRPDLPLPAGPDTRGAMHSITLTPVQTKALKEFAQRERTTVFMFLLAVLNLLLMRCGGQNDVAVGTPIAGRLQQETEDLIGCFINTLVLRSTMHNNPTFVEFLTRVRLTTVDAYEHQELPFEHIVELLRPPRDLQRTPLFDVMINMTNTPQTALTLDGLTVSPFEIQEPEAKVWFALYAHEHDGCLHLDIVYRKAIFSPAYVERFAQQYIALLTQVVSEPTLPVASYSLLTAETRAVLPDASIALDEPDHAPAPLLIQQQAAAQPNRVAVEKEGRVWTYACLEARATSIALLLRRQGLQRGEVVAVTGRRSFELIAAMVGVLRSGGVLLTLDPALPRQRRELMMQQADARFVLNCHDSNDHSVVDLPSNPDWRLLDVSPGCDWEVSDSPERLPELSADDAAYIFFTSGTTGTPKGILGVHKGLSHFLQWQRTHFAIGGDERCAQLTSLSFDVVLRDIFLPLISGATLCLPEDGVHLAPTHLCHWLQREQITLLHTVPSLADVWLEETRRERYNLSLRHIFFAGEPLRDALVERWRTQFGGTSTLVNLYGPTETTLAKCFYIVPEKPFRGIQPIGTPLPQTQALILTDGGQQCGIGEPGEIVIRTPFRTLGYNHPTQVDAARFVVNPWRDDPHDLLYRTGDLGCYRADGSLDILGRLDSQVKIRGIRIELGEIENVLRQHPAVVSCVVIVRGQELASPQLVAYVVAPSLLRVEPSGSHHLRLFLRDYLPEYMVPTRCIVLEALPLTANGKLDRRALPDLEELPEVPLPKVAQTLSDLEHRVAAVWQEVLHRDLVGIDDNFFDLGGHSLLMVQVQSRLSAALERDLSILDLFTYPTIRTLANHLEAAAESPDPTRNTTQQWAETRLDRLVQQRERRRSMHNHAISAREEGNGE